MVYTTSPNEPLAKEIAAAKAHKIPIMMDAADGIPPVDKLQLFAKMGCDLYTFSGGKGLCGPQSSGILLGRKDLIDGALANCNPWEGAVCRPMKVGKEEIMGCLAAVEAWLKMDVPKLNKGWTAQMERIATLLGTIPGVETKILSPEVDQCPTLSITWDQEAWRYSIADCSRELLEGTPSIAVMTEENPSDVLARKPGPNKPARKGKTLQIVSMTLRPGEEIIIGKRLRELLSQARKAATA
jgi:seryl-tRNA(Sec) selenium transferase